VPPPSPRRFPLSPRSILPALALLAAGACTPVPPAPPEPREATPVGASFGRTWDAVIDVFAARNIPIKTIERVSGLIATDPMAVARPGGGQSPYADCGKVMGLAIPPDRATYNVLVRGDSSQSTVKVTVRWTQGGTPDDPRLIECSTKGVWESEAEQAVKARAEGRPTGQ
jgi:hypothetical protein